MLLRQRYIDMLMEFKNTNFIKVVTGIRRCGKSSILRSYRSVLIEKGTPRDTAHFYNMEERHLADFCTDWTKFYDYIVSRFVDDETNYVFIDEIQNIENFQKLADALYVREDVDLYITGSNAYLLSGELATLLTGRYVEIKMLPFAFSEFVQMHSDKSRIEHLFSMYMKFGSLPETAQLYQNGEQSANAYLSAVIDSVIYKDVEFKHNFRDDALLKQVISFLFDSVGSEVSATNIANTLTSGGRKVSHNTIQAILQALLSSYIFYECKRNDLKGKVILKTLPKYYPVDLGMRNFLLGRDAGQDMGHLLENIVYFELLYRGYEVTIGKARASEVDFVAKSPNGYVSYFQVAWSVKNEETLERELKSLRAIKDSNPKYLLTTDIDIDPTYTGIKKLNVIDWLLSEDNI